MVEQLIGLLYGCRQDSSKNYWSAATDIKRCEIYKRGGSELVAALIGGEVAPGPCQELILVADCDEVFLHA